MFNEAQVSLTGYVANQPRYRTVGNDIPVLSMRVAWTPRRRDFTTGEWSDGNTSFVNVTCWRKLAENVSTCVHMGDPVLVKGKLEVRPYVSKDGERRTSVDVEASSVGPDLNRGVARFQRTRPPTGKTAEQYAAELAAGENGTRYGAGAGEERDGAGALPAFAGAGGPGDDDMFDDSAIEALANAAEGAAAPF
jgi:single-strand DNA-binding protein